MGNTPGDLLLFGPPGCGKTFLFHAVSNHVDGLFVVSQDISKIANNVRSEKPQILMIDDAHSQLDLIHQLRQLRSDVAANYRILANCWPGQRDAVAAALQITSASIRELRLLTRDEIVKVVKGAGIEGPNALIRELVDQADGRPGLAVTLARLCLGGDAQKVALGEALSIDIRLTFEPLVGKQAMNILSVIAVGGDHGMPLHAVAEYLELADSQVRDAVTLLAAGGVVNEVNQTTLSVRPEALRHALVRDTFFRGAFSLAIQGLIKLAPSRDGVALTLIGACRRGGTVPASLLRILVEKSTSGILWADYAGLGPSEAEWVLHSYPSKLSSVVRPALFYIPDKVIPLLLTAAGGDHRELHSNPDHPLRQIQDWIKSAWRGKSVAVLRRKILLDTALEWCASGGDLNVTLQAIKLSLAPDFETSEEDPGAGNTITLRWGYLPVNELNELAHLWPKALAALKSYEIANWNPLQELVQDWAYLHRPIKNPPREFLKKKKDVAIQLLRDVAELAKDHPGVLQWAKRIGKSLNAKLSIIIDPEYETLFPIENLQDIYKFQRQAGLRAKTLAQNWAKSLPQDTVKRLVTFEKEASLSGRTWPRMSPNVCREIARVTDQPIAWLKALIEEKAPSDLLHPFIEKAKAIDALELGDVLTACFQQPPLRGTAALTVLAMPNPPEELLRLCLSSLTGMAKSIKFSCINEEIPEQHVLLLLRHEDGAIASAAAIGEWRNKNNFGVRDSLRETWRQIVVKHVKDSYDLEAMFKADSSLALDWLRASINEDQLRTYRDEQSISKAIEALGVDDRRQLLKEIDEQRHLAEPVIKLLVGDSLELYRDLLNRDRLRSLHLVPLKGHPDEDPWRSKAQLALDGGYSPEDVASAVYGHSWAWTGEESTMWDTWAKRFKSLETHPDLRLRSVGKIGQKNAESLSDRAKQHESEIAIHGRRMGSF